MSGTPVRAQSARPSRRQEVELTPPPHSARGRPNTAKSSRTRSSARDRGPKSIWPTSTAKEMESAEDFIARTTVDQLHAESLASRSVVHAWGSQTLSPMSTMEMPNRRIVVQQDAYILEASGDRFSLRFQPDSFDRDPEYQPSGLKTARASFARSPKVLGPKTPRSFTDSLGGFRPPVASRREMEMFPGSHKWRKWMENLHASGSIAGSAQNDRPRDGLQLQNNKMIRVPRVLSANSETLGTTAQRESSPSRMPSGSRKGAITARLVRPHQFDMHQIEVFDHLGSRTSTDSLSARQKDESKAEDEEQGDFLQGRTRSTWRLAVDCQPPRQMMEGTVVPGPPSVVLLDKKGSIERNNSGFARLEIRSKSGEVELIGNTLTPLVNGRAAFGSLRIQGISDFCQLKFTLEETVDSDHDVVMRLRVEKDREIVYSEEGEPLRHVVAQVVSQPFRVVPRRRNQVPKEEQAVAQPLSMDSSVNL